jgi:hypothetical protein
LPWVQLSGRRMRRLMSGTSLSGTLPESVGNLKALEQLCVCPLSRGHVRLGLVLYGWAGCRYRTSKPWDDGIGRHIQIQLLLVSESLLNPSDDLGYTLVVVVLLVVVLKSVYIHQCWPVRASHTLQLSIPLHTIPTVVLRTSRQNTYVTVRCSTHTSYCALEPGVA